MWLMGLQDQRVPELKLLQSFLFKHVKGVGNIFRDISNLLNIFNRAEKITDTWREDGRWDELSLSQMHNGIKYIFNFDVT